MERSKGKFDGKASALVIRFFAMSLVFGFATVITACSSGTENAKKGPRSSRSNANSVANANESGLNASSNETASLTEGNSLAANANANERPLTRVEKLRVEAANKPVSPTAGVNSRPGPEDSVIYTELKDVAREIRVFKKHPTLAKVEKIYSGSAISVKVYIRDGRVIEVPSSAIVYLDQTPSSTILQIAGIPQPQAPASNARPQTPARKKEAN